VGTLPKTVAIWRMPGIKSYRGSVKVTLY